MKVATSAPYAICYLHAAVEQGSRHATVAVSLQRLKYEYARRMEKVVTT